MKDKCSLFTVEPPDKVCLPYDLIRKRKDNNLIMAHQNCEDLWSDFWKYADDHFLPELAINFHQRWFEMYLAVSLLRSGIFIESENHGPDILALKDGRRVWVEAVCASEGQQEKPDSVPELQFGTLQRVPIREYVIRIRSSLKEKSEKFKTYIHEGIVVPGDLTVIAINMGQITFMSTDMDECFKRALYGVGDPIISIDRVSGGIVGINREERASVPKASGAKIGVQCFTDGSMEHISAVLGSRATALGFPNPLGDDFVLYPNLTSNERCPSGLFSLGKECTFRETKEGWVGNLIWR